MIECAPLLGHRVALLAGRRDTELAGLLHRYGAAVTAATTTSVGPGDDPRLRSQTERLVEAPPDVLIATTATGLREWLTAAGGWGLGEALAGALRGVRSLSYGPKVAEVLQAAGLAGTGPTVSLRELIVELIEAGRRRDGSPLQVAVQLPAATGNKELLADLLGVLGALGAEVVPIQPIRAETVTEGGDFDRVIADLAERRFDAVAFGSAATVTAMLRRAGDLGLAERLIAALRGGTRVVAGPGVEPLLARCGVATTTVGAGGATALAHRIADELQRGTDCTVHAAGHRIDVGRDRVLVDGRLAPMTAAPLAMLRVLARNPGRVVGRDELMAVLPGHGGSGHAVDAAVARLRGALGDKRIVGTVIKRGYRLAVD